MKRLLIFAVALCGAVAHVQADPPGPLDGQNIPTNFADSKLVGIQTNYTGVGDVTQLEAMSVYTDGSELDALYLAKDSEYLYVGLAGNLLEVGSPFIILIDNPLDFGQTELWTEGVDGPAFVLQLAGRQVVVDDNGTPEDLTDDTYTVVSNSGLLLPDCGDPFFTGWDYALAVDVADNATMYAHEYILYDFPIGTASEEDLCHFGDGRGRVPCDPTPDNPNDPPLQVYAFRTLVASTPINDGNEVLEGDVPHFGYQRGGFDNSNTLGVTDTDASQAATALTGLELSIPLAYIGDSGLFGDETVNLMILTMDGDEYGSSTVSEGYGTVLNQALPSLSGASCDPPAGLGMRPNLSTVAGCLTLDLSTISLIDTGAVLDGVIVPSDYTSSAPILTQQCPTSGGDQQQLPDILVPVEQGSELDAFYVDHDDQFIYLGLTGNLEAKEDSINIFVDVDAGSGDTIISDFTNFAFSDTYEQWTTATFTPTFTDFRVESTDFGGGWYYIDPSLDASGTSTLTLDFTANAANVADTIRVILTDEDLTEWAYEFAVPGAGTYSLSLPVSGYAEESNPGGVPGLDLSKLAFFHLTGGFNNGDPGVLFDVTFDRLQLTDDDAGQHLLNFDPGPGAFTTTVVENFGNFEMSGTYATWSLPTATITSGPTDYRVEAAGGFGGGYYDISPNVNMTGASHVELEVTLNPACSEGGVLLVLADDDGTEQRWTWYGLSPGTYTLTSDFSSGTTVVAGSVPGFDVANVSYFHLQGDFVTTDITFDTLSVISVLPGVAPVLFMNGNELPNGPLDVLNNGLFAADVPVQYDVAYGINLSYAPHLAYVDYFDLANNTFAFRGAVVPGSGDATLFDDPGGETAVNPNGLQMAIDNTNISGVIGCDDSLPCFLDDYGTVAALADDATTGVEIAIPLADLGLSAGDLPRIVRVWTMIGERQGYASNQSLPSMRNTSYEGNQVLNPGDAPFNFTDPTSGPSAGAVISDFSNVVPDGTYGVWGTGTLTSGPDDFRVQSYDFGGCYFFLNPNIDASGATDVVLDVTLNPANQTNQLVVVLFDADGTTRVYRWEGLTNGTQTLSKPLADYISEDAPGAIPGLDLAHLSQFNIAGAFHHGNPGWTLDVTFDNLELVGGLRNFEARAARICLSTVEGDADCDGDNDLIDAMLLQQCFGRTPDPILPMECLQLDLVKDDVIDMFDFAEFETLLDGPVVP